MEEMEEYVLCMVKRVGNNTFRFYFARREELMNFFGEDFEQKPSSICSDLIPTDGCYEFAYNATSKTNKVYCSSERSSVYSVQDSLDNCVALLFERGVDDKRLILHCGESLYDVSEKLFKSGFILEDDFPQKPPTAFLKEKLKEVELQDANILAFVRLHNSVRLNNENTIYTYNLYFVHRSRLREFKNSNDWFDKQDTMNYAPFDIETFDFDGFLTAKSKNIRLDTIEQQNEYSMNECLDNAVCLASENIDGEEYPEYRVVLNVGDRYEEVIDKLEKKGFTCF